MKEVLNIVQLILALIITFLILIQPKGKGIGRSISFASTTSFTRRGLDRIVFRMTFVFVFLFLAVSFLQLF